MRVQILAGLLLLLAACQTVQLEPEMGRETAVPLPTSTSIPPTPDPLTPPKRRLNAGELQLAADIDDIPAIFADSSLFLDAAAGSQEWGDEELVIALEVNGMAKAYPVRLLSLHEIVNDDFDGRPVLVTWCPLCFSAIAFDPVVDGRALTFGVSGYLYNDNLVMYDHQTNTLWSQLLGQAMRGALRPTQLSILPSLLTRWGDWKAARPDTLILSAQRVEQVAAEDLIDPYAGYYTSGAAGFSSGLALDERLPSKTLVAGLLAGADTRAYPLETMRQETLINDQLGALPALLIFDPELEAVRIYNRRTAAQTLTFAWSETPGQLVDRETGTVWDAAAGVAISGPLNGESLTQLSGPLVFWFAWAAIHPDTTIYGAE